MTGLTVGADQFTTVLPVQDAFVVVVHNQNAGVSGAAFVVRDGVATPFLASVDAVLPAVDGGLIAVTYHYGEHSTADLVGIGLDGVPRWQRSVGDQYVVGDTPFGFLINTFDPATD